MNVIVTDGCTQNNNQGCEFNCVNNFDDTYTCECGDTEVLAADQKSCEGQWRNIHTVILQVCSFIEPNHGFRSLQVFN